MEQLSSLVPSTREAKLSACRGTSQASRGWLEEGASARSIGSIRGKPLENVGNDIPLSSQLLVNQW